MTTAMRKFCFSLRGASFMAVLVVIGSCSLPSIVIDQTHSTLDTTTTAPIGAPSLTSGTIEPTLKNLCPSGNAVAVQKLLFFYDHPDLVQLRDEIVNGICNYSEGK